MYFESFIRIQWQKLNCRERSSARNAPGQLGCGQRGSRRQGDCEEFRLTYPLEDDVSLHLENILHTTSMPSTLQLYISGHNMPMLAVILPWVDGSNVENSTGGDSVAFR